jgi:uncharacterized protein YjbJ (UPF0337 family)
VNWDQVEGKWKQLRGGVKEKWGKLTDDDLDQIAGKRDQFVGRLQERYGIAKEEAQHQADQWLRAQQDAAAESAKYHQAGRSGSGTE